jgi:TonB family protein
MKHKSLIALVLSLLMLCIWIVSIAQPTQLRGQDNSTEETYDGEPVYRVVGQVVTPPHPTYQPDPEYDDASRKAKVQGVVVLSMIVTKEGRTADLKIKKSLTPSLDQKAIEAVSRWRFDPATKDGKPVAVWIAVETSFHLYNKN